MTFMWRYHMCVLSQLASGHRTSAHRISNRVYSLMVDSLVCSIIYEYSVTCFLSFLKFSFLLSHEIKKKSINSRSIRSHIVSMKNCRHSVSPQNVPIYEKFICLSSSNNLFIYSSSEGVFTLHATTLIIKRKLML